MPSLDEKLELLRKRWKEEPENRKVIEMQAKFLTFKSKKLYGDDLVKTAEKIFK